MQRLTVNKRKLFTIERIYRLDQNIFQVSYCKMQNANITGRHNQELNNRRLCETSELTRKKTLSYSVMQIYLHYK